MPLRANRFLPVMRKRRATVTTLLVCAICLLVEANADASCAGRLRAPGLPVVQTLGCRLNGLNVVCDRNTTLLPNREQKLKLRKKEGTQPAKPTPAQTKSKSPSVSTKSDNTKSKPSSGQSSKSKAEPAKDESAKSAHEPEGEALENPGQHSCLAGDVVLAKPNASGSYCEPVGASKPETKDDAQEQKPAAEPKSEVPAAPKATGNAPAAASATDAAIPANIRAAACGPGAEQAACACPGGSDFNSAACKAAIPSCCSAEVSDGGKPQPAISRCSTDQNAAMSSVVSSAMEKKLTLGSVRCTNQ